MKKSAALYVALLVIFGLGIGVALAWGHRMPPGPAAAPAESRAADSVARPAGGARLEGLKDPLGGLFLQLLVILIVSRAVGLLFARMGQPTVVGEMFAGILLGPSLFGALWPEGFRFVFPGPTLGTLQLLSQIGVVLFMFVVGMDLDLGHVRRQAGLAILVSHAGILFPYFLGVVVSLFLFPRLAGPGIGFVSFALFMGISMSITAFPVLARILKERGLEKTPLGAAALTSAAIDDVTAWSLLAGVVALVRSESWSRAVYGLGGAGIFAAVLLLVLRPRLGAWLGADRPGGESPTPNAVAGVLVLTFASALATELMGIHAFFGAFLAGVAMPARSEFRDFLRIRIESLSSTFLLPLFFAFTGLRTQIGLLNGAQGWLVAGGIVLVATAGKLGGCLLAARFTGMTLRDSFALGALMNTRGLMELIAINIGYDLGILSPEIFAMLVLMALATTFLTGPLLSLGGLRAPRAPAPS